MNPVTTIAAVKPNRSTVTTLSTRYSPRRSQNSRPMPASALKIHIKATGLWVNACKGGSGGPDAIRGVIAAKMRMPSQTRFSTVIILAASTASGRGALMKMYTRSHPRSQASEQPQRSRA